MIHKPPQMTQHLPILGIFLINPYTAAFLKYAFARKNRSLQHQACRTRSSPAEPQLKVRNSMLLSLFRSYEELCMSVCRSIRR